ncbi:MAG: transposase [Candidatus Aenigmarchaeota archaeon]|nr:transposase [Candidatus Aenigmarchaeota archaeon]
MKYHRPTEGKPKTITVKKMPSGKYFATICCETTREKIVDRFLDRVYKCECGLFVDRDYNSAMVTLLRGIGSERSESTPFGDGTLLSKKASAVGELGSSTISS